MLLECRTTPEDGKVRCPKCEGVLWVCESGTEESDRGAREGILNSPEQLLEDGYGWTDDEEGIDMTNLFLD